MGELITKSVYYVKAAITDHNGSISRNKHLLLLLLCYLLRQTLATPGCDGSTNDTQLCSSPQNLSVVCPGASLTFTCMTVGSPFLAWISDQYVSDMGAELFFTFRETIPLRKPSPNGASFANLTKVNASDQTMIMLESQLHIVVSNQYNSSQIICSNTGSGTNIPINFNVDLARTSVECQNRSFTTAVASNSESTTQLITSTSLAPTSKSLTTMDILLMIVVPIIIAAFLLIVAIIVTILCCCCVPCCPCHHSKSKHTESD